MAKSFWDQIKEANEAIVKNSKKQRKKKPKKLKGFDVAAFLGTKKTRKKKGK